MTFVAPLGANLLLLCAALSLGSLLRPLLPQRLRPFDRFTVVFVGGLGLLGTLLFCVGLFYFSRLCIVLLLLGGILVGGRSLLLELRCLRGETGARPTVPRLPALLLLLILGVTLVGGFAQPVGDMNNDAIAYHYLGPRVWLRQQVIRPVPDEMLTYFPVLVESEYAALMAVGGDTAPALLSVVQLAALLLVVACLARRCELDSRWVWWAAALVAVMPAVYRGAYGGFLDAFFAAFVLLAVRLAFDAQRPLEFALAGAFCGFALATKYTAIIAVLLLLLCAALLLFLRRQSFAAVLRCVGAAAAAALVLGSPVYLRNWISYGCPIYPPPPALLHFFAARGITPRILHELTRNVIDSGAGLGRGWIQFLLLPFNLTYHTADFHGAGGIGLVPFALGPIGFAAVRRDAFARVLALFAFLFLVSWFATAQVSRYLFVVYVIALVFGVVGWRCVWNNSGKIGRSLAALLVATSVLYGTYMIVTDRKDDMHAALSATFQQQRRIRDTPWLESFDFLNRDPAVRRVLLLDPNIGPYYLTKDYVKPFGRWGERTIPGVENVSDVLARIGTLGVTHIMDVCFDNAPFQIAGQTPGLTLVFSSHHARIYRVDPR